jgi:hypothetical protein
MLFALSMAASGDAKPPSLYVDPPMERKIVLNLDWHALMPSLGVFSVAEWERGEDKPNLGAEESRRLK